MNISKPLGGLLALSLSVYFGATLAAQAQRSPGPSILAQSASRAEISLVPIAPGGQQPVDQQSAAAKKYQNDPEAIKQGRQLFLAFNCVGCHFNGAGGIGPSLMDNKWIYGSSMENIASTIIEGRPNGMPSFRALVAGDDTVYKLAAYVRSLSQSPAATQQTEAEAVDAAKQQFTAGMEKAAQAKSDQSQQ